MAGRRSGTTRGAAPENREPPRHRRASFSQVFRGQKVFYLIKPTPENLKAYEAWICDAKQDTTFFPDTIGGPSECARVEVNAGQTFFIPSGWLHAVLTPVDSLVFGGNFLPGLATVDLQLAVRDIERRTHVKKEYTFPYFVPCLFFGLVEVCAPVRRSPPIRLSPVARAG